MMKKLFYFISALMLLTVSCKKDDRPSNGKSGVDGRIPIPEAVDLGLPSGLKWASFNLGASKPEEYGDYYAWAETQTYYSSLEFEIIDEARAIWEITWKDDKTAGYSWGSYQYCKYGNPTCLTKYSLSAEFSFWDGEGPPDGKKVLDLTDDAAHVNLGGNWRIPTDAEWTELLTNCTWAWTSQNGVDGYSVTATNGNGIFFPFAGYLGEDPWGVEVSYSGHYWSSSLNTDVAEAGYNRYALCVELYLPSYVDRGGAARFYGYSVRPVTE